MFHAYNKKNDYHNLIHRNTVSVLQTAMLVLFFCRQNENFSYLCNTM